MSLYLVYLRRPLHLNDKRNDPFWEFGSFGKTGCHSRNLLHLTRTPLRDGDRLAFIQGGKEGIRIVGVTPEIEIKGTAIRLELTWDAAYRPLPYSEAPLLIDNKNITHFPKVRPILANTDRATLCGAAGSRLRSRKAPVDDELAEQIMQRFSTPELPKITTYLEAIEAPTGSWHHNAKLRDWGSLINRLLAYESLG